MQSFDHALPYPSRRAPMLARNVVATSQPLAAQAGLRMLLAGGNAADAAVAAAIALAVVEPTGNGVGSDAFAIVHDGREISGLNASGRAPAAWTPDRFDGLDAMPRRGWDSVTVPGAVSAWVALSERYGSLPFAELFGPAIAYAREGFAVGPAVAATWERVAESYRGQPGFEETFLPGGRAPRAGETFAYASLADTLEEIAETRGDSFYRGRLAEAMSRHAAACGGGLVADDLARHTADWCGTISVPFANGQVHEIPPSGQGIAALVALGLLSRVGIERHPPDSPDSLHLQIEATKLAMADTAAYVADPGSMAVTPAQMLDDGYLDARAALIDPERAGDPGAGRPAGGGTVYLAAADASGMMVSFIQSNYEGFGSGVVVPGTDISLQNRGLGFSLKGGHPNRVGPKKRSFHTIIPGFMTDASGPLMAFGVMGGPMQPQGHVQLVLRTQLHGQNPQAASDAPRWRVVGGLGVALEDGTDPSVIRRLEALGHRVQAEPPEADWAFGGAQVICRTADGYVAGSDHRKDGCAVGF